MAELFPPWEAHARYQGLMNRNDQNEVETAGLRQQQEVQKRAMEATQAQLPVVEQQRELALSQGRGALQRQPDLNTRLGAEAQAAAAPGRIASDREGADMASQALVRQGRMREQADQMDTFTQAFDPIMTAQKEGDYAGMNSAWDSFFETMEKHKTPGVDKWRLTPRDQLFNQLQPRYTQTLNTVPVLREKIKLEDAQSHAKELAEINARSREKVANTRSAGGQPPKTMQAMFTQIMGRVNSNDPAISANVSDADRSFAQGYLEGDLTEAEQARLDSFYSEKSRLGYLDSRKAEIATKYPKLYGKKAAATLPPGIPAGSKIVGSTTDGQDVWLTPDGKQYARPKAK